MRRRDRWAARCVHLRTLYRCGATRMELGASLALRLYVPVLTTIENRSLSSVASAPLLISSLQQHQTRNARAVSRQHSRPARRGLARHGECADRAGERSRGRRHNDQTQRPLEPQQSLVQPLSQARVVRLDLRHAKAVQIRQAMPQPGDCVGGGGAGAGGVGGAAGLKKARAHVAADPVVDVENAAAGRSQRPCPCTNVSLRSSDHAGQTPKAFVRIHLWAETV